MVLTRSMDRSKETIWRIAALSAHATRGPSGSDGCRAAAWCRPVAHDAVTEFEVGLGKVVADGQQWFVGELGGRVAHTIAEIEAGWVSGAAETQVGALRDIGVVGGVFDYLEVDFAVEPVEESSSDRALPGGEDDQGFGEGGRTDTGVVGAGQRHGDLLGLRFVLDEGDQCRGVDDHGSDAGFGVVAEDLFPFLLGGRRGIGQQRPDLGAHDMEQLGAAVDSAGLQQGQLGPQGLADRLCLVAVTHTGGELVCETVDFGVFDIQSHTVDGTNFLVRGISTGWWGGPPGPDA